ncbi:MAG: hypothetical protein GXP40_03120, partial [Chloroflexi bacterium]|nr:hypothetical protein [Chloroflexota bacterium]
MKRKGLGCFSFPAIVATLITLIVISGVAYASGGSLFSAGGLNAQAGGVALGGVASHAEIGDRCEACHAAPWSFDSMADRCMNCHADVRVQMADPRSLHGVLYQEKPRGSCRVCHTEHRGADSPLTDMSMADFPHDSLGFSLRAHARTADDGLFSCSDCHVNERYDQFEQTICVDCHRQIDAAFTGAHALGFGADCLACHDGVETIGRNFDHNRVVFQLTGKHASVICWECHLGARSLTDLQSAPQVCVDCHYQDEPHDGRFGLDCESCHTADGWTPADFDHTLANFQLAGRHVDVACEDCHTAGTYQGAPQDCYSCHQKDDRHNGQFGASCEACHTPAGWDQVNIDHSLFAFQLTGAHVSVACEDCHQNDIFKGTPTTCNACHAGVEPHQGRFGADC